MKPGLLVSPLTDAGQQKILVTWRETHPGKYQLRFTVNRASKSGGESLASVIL